MKEKRAQSESDFSSLITVNSCYLWQCCSRTLSGKYRTIVPRGNPRLDFCKHLVNFHEPVNA